MAFGFSQAIYLNTWHKTRGFEKMTRLFLEALWLEIRNVNSVLSTVIMNYLLQEFTPIFSVPCNTKITVKNVVRYIYNFVISGEDFFLKEKYTLTTSWLFIPVMFKKKWTCVMTLQKKPRSHEMPSVTPPKAQHAPSKSYSRHLAKDCRASQLLIRKCTRPPNSQI